MEHAPLRPRLHRRQRATTTVATRAVANTAIAPVAAAETFRPGVANTATGRKATEIAPTTPPTKSRNLNTVSLTNYASSFAALNTAYVPGQRAATSATSRTAAGHNGSTTQATQAAAVASSSSIVDGLSNTAFIAICAGGGGALLILFVVLGWCCCKRKQAKKDEGNWLKLNAERSAGPTVGGKPVRLVDNDPWSKGQIEHQEKNWGRRDEFRTGAATNGEAREGGFGTDGRYGFAEQSRGNVSARDELLGTGGPTTDRWNHEVVHDVVAFAPPSTRAYGAPSPTLSKSNYRLTPSESPPRQTRFPHQALDHSGQGYPFPVTADSSQRAPARGTEYRGPLAENDDGPDSGFMGVMTGGGRDSVDEQAMKRRSVGRKGMASRKKDTVMDFASAYGDGGSDDEDSMPSFGGDQAWGQVTPDRPAARTPPPALVLPPQREASHRFPPSSAPASSPPATIDSFPPPPRTSPLRRTPESRYSRVDSRPLHELEDILDSFAYNSHGEPLPPMPEGGNVRTLSTSSNAPVVRPLATNRERDPVTQDSLPPSSSRSPGSLGLAKHIEVDHYPVSIHSAAGEVGDSSQRSTPARPSTPSRIGTGPTANTLLRTPPSIIRSDSKGHHTLDMSRSIYSSGGSTDPGDGLPSPVLTQVVRKISLGRSAQAPVRLNREDSLRDRRRPTPAEHELFSEMRLDSPTSSAGSQAPSFDHHSHGGSSPSTTPTTPRDQQFSPSFGKQHGEPDSRGFVPLAAMTLDPGAQHYRSATESMYAMYDNLPPELQGLSKEDPRVSRHLSSFGGIQGH